jgi:hypothetical protein
MRAKGGVCSQLADLGDIYVANGNLHMINDQGAYRDDFTQRDVHMGGAAPRYGADTSYIVIGSNFTGSWYDASHMTSEGSESRTLQQLLAHELDHLHGSDHFLNPDGSYNAFRTDNSQRCSDLPGV